MTYYIYRNLRMKDTFSLRVDGRVVVRETHFLAFAPTFKVNPAGRARVLRERSKNVHAFVVTEAVQRCYDFNVEGLKQITYNPYKADTFMLGDSPISKADIVVFKHGKCWLVR